MSRKAANIFAAQIILKPNSVIGLATGTSPVGLYKQLINMYNQNEIDFSQVKAINLDEYIGLPKDHPQSYSYFMKKNFFSSININPANCYIPDGMTDDIKKECSRYDEIISNLGGIDIQLLGIGNNGHIGFNEPGSAFELQTHCVVLEESTIEANSRFFENAEGVPKRAITVGIKSIMQAKIILLIASGKNKADALYNAFFGPVTPALPASILQMHNNVFVVADEEALSTITEKNAFTHS